MGLITKSVEVGLRGSGITYYASKGYEMPKAPDSEGRVGVPKGTRILVDVNDLPAHSNKRVELECDLCHKRFGRTWQEYNLRYHEDGKVYCSACGKTVLNSGPNNYRWRNDITDEERRAHRLRPEYLEFAAKVRARDKYTCAVCGKKDRHPHVHHLNGYTEYVDQRLDETNAITLCPECHRKFHSIYTEIGNTREQFEEWIGHPVGELGKYDGELPKGRRVICIDNNMVFDTAKDAGRYFGLKSEYISRNCRGVSHSCGGRHFAFLCDYSNTVSNGH